MQILRATATQSDVQVEKQKRSWHGQAKEGLEHWVENGEQVWTEI